MDSKTLVIYASPKKDSFTKKILSDKIKNLDNVSFFDCFKSSPFPCDDCGFCKNKNGCSKDDLNEFFRQFEKSEKIIFAFPVYNGSVPAPLKALLDRFQRFFSARFVRNHKPAISGQREVTIIMTMGGEKDISEYVLEQFLPIFTICGCTLKKCYSLSGTDNLSLDDELVPKIYEF